MISKRSTYFYSTRTEMNYLCYHSIVFVVYLLSSFPTLRGFRELQGRALTQPGHREDKWRPNLGDVQLPARTVTSSG